MSKLHVQLPECALADSIGAKVIAAGRMDRKRARIVPRSPRFTVPPSPKELPSSRTRFASLLATRSEEGSLLDQSM